MAVAISHDAYGRFEIVREIIVVNHKNTCDWCGQNGRRYKAGPSLSRLFRYGTAQDDRPGRVNWTKGMFCSAACWRMYHDI